MKMIVCLALFIIIVSAMNISAFNDNRRGFVLGAGIGFCPYAHNSADISSIDDFDESGTSSIFMIGHGWDNRNLTVIYAEGVSYERDLEQVLGNSRQVDISQGFAGIAYFHYFKESSPTIFLMAGIGLQQWLSLDSDVGDNDSHAGYMFGAGYEFKRHFQAHVNISFGKTDRGTVGFKHQQLFIGVTAIAF